MPEETNIAYVTVVLVTLLTFKFQQIVRSWFWCVFMPHSVFKCAQKLTGGHLNLAHGTEKKRTNNEETKNKKMDRPKETVRVIVNEMSPGGEVKLWGKDL